MRVDSYIVGAYSYFSLVCNHSNWAMYTRYKLEMGYTFLEVVLRRIGYLRFTFSASRR